MDPHPSGGFYSLGWALSPVVPLTTGATGLKIYTLISQQLGRQLGEGLTADFMTPELFGNCGFITTGPSPQVALLLSG